MPKDNAFPNRLHDKRFLVLRSALRKQFVNRTARRNALQQFLQMALRINIDRFLRDLLEIGSRLFENKFFGRSQIAIEVDRSNQRLVGIGQCGWSFASTAALLAASYQK